MKYMVFGPDYVVRLDPGERIVESLSALCVQDDIGLAWFSGLGAVASAEIGWFDVREGVHLKTRIDEPCELVSLTGNVTRMDDRPFIHAHAVLAGRDSAVRGGHLKEAVVSITVEITLHRTFDSMGRRVDPRTGALVLDIKPDGE